MAIYRHILVAVDLTPDSLPIGQRARELADAVGGELEIINVVEPLAAVAPIPPDAIAPAIVQTHAELLEAANKHVGNLAQQLDVPRGRWNVVVGNIKSEILRAATEGKADLIVIGSRGRHALAFLIKPTEDVVVHRAPCDVLAVRL